MHVTEMHVTRRAKREERNEVTDAMESDEIDPRLNATPEQDPSQSAPEGAPSVKEGETEADKELPPDQDAFQTDSS